MAAGLSGFPPEWTARAETALELLTAEVADPPDPARAWSSSDLTGDGFPFELAFTTVDSALRWTFDPAGGDLDPARRLKIALSGLARLGQSPAPEHLACAIKPQRGCRKGFGAWIGGRHDDKNDRYKLYVNLPDGPEADQALAAFGLPRPRLPGAEAETRMFGLGPEPGRVEVYFRSDLPVESLPRLLEPAGVAESATFIRAGIEAAWGHRLRDRLPGGSVGFSFAATMPGQVPTITIFLFARALWGGDGRIRTRMFERFRAVGACVEPYATATAPLANARTAQTRHGVVGLTPNSGGVHWSIGLRPIARVDHEA